MPKTVSILGASGYVGQYSSIYFADEGDVVRAIGRSAPDFNYTNVYNEAVNYENQDEVNKVFATSDVVIIAIGIPYSTKEWQKTWPKYAQIFDKAIRQSGTRTIFFDNVYPYGKVKKPMTEETDLNPTSKKGEVRLQVDKIFLQLIEENYPVIIARSADFYGPHIGTSVMSERFHEQIINEGVFEWLGSPYAKHTFTYVPDMAPALHALAHSQTKGVYHLPTTKQQYTGEDIKKFYEAKLNKNLQVRTLSGILVRILGIGMQPLRELAEMMYQYNEDYVFDSSKIEREFPQLTPTSYETGLEIQLQSYLPQIETKEEETFSE